MVGFIDSVAKLNSHGSKIFEAIVGDQKGLRVELSRGDELFVSGQDPYRPIFGHLLESARDDGGRFFFEGDEGKLKAIRPVVSGHVVSIVETAGDLIEVEVTNSHSIHVLRSDNPRFEELAERLRTAARTGGLVSIASDRDILEVRLENEKSFVVEDDAAPPSVSALVESQDQGEALEWGKIVQVFKAIAIRHCDVMNVGAPCIPFAYPTNWCWTRAHAMAQILIHEHGVVPGKVWIRGRLRAATRNDPDCQVRWGWHVAPLLMARKGEEGDEFPVVFDPSMFDEPVTRDEWVSAQNDANARLISTSWEVYNYTRGGSVIRDANFARVEADLKRARRHLMAQIASDGPPPYAHCEL